MKNIFIVGDSTACDYVHFGENNRFPRAGWGQMLSLYITDYNIINLALSGRSSKSFKNECNYVRLKKELKTGDYLIIQFGHNDAKIEDIERYTDPNTTYISSICEYIQIAKNCGAEPILATSISRLEYNDKILFNYVVKIRELAKDLKIKCIDLNKKTVEYIMNSKNPREIFMYLDKIDDRFISNDEYKNSEYYNRVVEDSTHLNINGAKLIAEFVYEDLYRVLK